MAESTWRYKRDDGEEQTASESELQDMLAKGALPADTLVWADYLGQWTPASQIAAFVASIQIDTSTPEPTGTSEPAADPQPDSAPPAIPEPVPLPQPVSEPPPSSVGPLADPEPKPQPTAEPQPEVKPGLITPAPDMVPALPASPVPDTPVPPPIMDPLRKPHPWFRFWARMIDTNLSMFLAIGIGIFTAFLFGFITGLFKVESETLSQNVGYFGMVLGFLTYVWMEPVCLTAFGTTLGKFLFNIRLRTGDGSKLTFTHATKRAFDVWVRGGGLASSVPLPPISGLITIIQWCHAYSVLDRSGATTWDRNGGFTYEHHQIGIGRGIGIFLAFTFPFFLAFVMLLLILVAAAGSSTSSP